MIPYERQKKILSIIEEKELVKIDELQKIFDGVSVSTLRRDLKELEKNRKIESFSGGAFKKNIYNWRNTDFNEKYIRK